MNRVFNTGDPVFYDDKPYYVVCSYEHSDDDVRIVSYILQHADGTHTVDLWDREMQTSVLHAHEWTQPAFERGHPLFNKHYIKLQCLLRINAIRTDTKDVRNVARKLNEPAALSALDQLDAVIEQHNAKINDEFCAEMLAFLVTSKHTDLPTHKDFPPFLKEHKA